MTQQLTRQIAENLGQVHARIAEAAGRSGRPADAVQLVAVSKYVGQTEARALVTAGCRVLGESRPQQLLEKADALADVDVAWHIIGHLQRNKVRRVLPRVAMIQSVDSVKLLAAIERIAAEQSLCVPVPVLLEVNVSGETAKHGFAPEAVGPLLDQWPGYSRVAVRGLMAMASRGDGAEAARPFFRILRDLRDRLLPNCPEGVRLDELSMGMSGDYEVAIEEGATIVRVGSRLFEGVR